MAALPHLVQLHEKHKGKVIGISLNLDFDEDEGSPDKKLQSSVQAKLSELSIRCENYISSDAFSTVTEKFKTFLPAVLIYDKSGKLHKKLDGEFSYKKDVREIVEALLKS